MEKPFRRILLKISGEALAGPLEYGIHPPTLAAIAGQVSRVHETGISIGVVTGGGNIFRGVAGSAQGMSRTTADYMGMVATVMNAVALQDALETQGVSTRVQTAIEMRELAETYVIRRALRHLEKGRVVIFAAGTGNPYFTTDTAAALRANEIGADVLLKATKVDGIYDRDPVEHDNAKKFDNITYIQALERRLKVMDAAAISLCMDNNLPIIVFNLNGDKNIERIVQGEQLGTWVSHSPREQ